MTNQLTYTDTTTSTTVQRPTRTITSTSDDQPKRPSGGRGWILIAGGAALAVAAVVGFAATRNDPTEPAEPKAQQRPAYLIIQDEIDAALAGRNSAAETSPATTVGNTGTSQQLVQESIDKALAENANATPTAGPGTSQQLVQESIDKALAENANATPTAGPGTSQQLVQESIDKALAENAISGRGPNADLPRDQTVGSRPVNLGPNADLPTVAGG